MSLSRDQYISIHLSRKTAIPQLLEGWQYWLDLGLISEQGIPSQVVAGHDLLRVDFTTTLTIENLIQQLQFLENIIALGEEKNISLTIKISASEPLLLEGLDRWLKLGLLDHTQVKDIARKNLVSPIPVIAVTTPPTTVAETSNLSLPVPTNKVTKIREKRRRKPRVTQIAQSLMAELSIIWLLLLGVFMVVISSGVIAASWWQRSSAVLQYAILWLYTLGFGVASWWTGKQTNLRLTTQGLRIVTLLLVPINFWAMDSFPLWHTFLGLIGMLVGSLSLTGLTIKFFKPKSQSFGNSLSLLNHLGLTYLHWGWTLPGIPIIATYIGVIGTTIITLISPQKNENNKHFLPFSLSGGIVIYALIILLVRAIFITEVSIFQLGLAVGLCGWLIGWRSPPKTPWKWIGAGLLSLGWLLSVFVMPMQAITISFLAISLLVRRLKYSGSRRDFIITFLIGLQVNWLFFRLPILQPIWGNIIDLSSANNYPFVLTSIGLFPYLFIIILTRHFWLNHNQVKLYRFSGAIILLFGFILTTLSLINPLVRTINLTLSTLTLGYETRHKLKKEQCFFLKPLALITHISFILTLASGINYYFPKLSINMWSLILLGLMIGELLISLLHFLEPSLSKLLNNDSWVFGLFLATISYGLFWFKLPSNLPFWGLSWLIVPTILSAIATWYLPRRKSASELSVISICLTQALTIYFPETRLIGLIVGTILMIVNTQYLRHLYSVIITVSLGLITIFFYLYILDLSSSLWLLSGVIITLLLWFIRHVLIENTSNLALIYAQVFDSFAYILSLISLIQLIDVSLVYTAATNTLISSVTLMVSVAYRSWQPSTRSNSFPLLYSILILAMVPLPALSLPLWGWIELGIATMLMAVQTQIFKQVNTAFITIGFILELMVVVLEDNGLKYAEQFWVYWLLVAAIITILFWITYHIINYYQINSIDYYKKALDIWGIILSTFTVTAISFGRLATDYLLNNDLILLITINLIMIGTAYRSWQKSQQNSLLWFSIITIIIIQFSNPNLSFLNILTPIIGTILIFSHSYLSPSFSTAFITIGMAIFCRSFIVLAISPIFKIPIIPTWMISDSVTLIFLWSTWNYLKHKNKPLAIIYTKIIDVWGIILCSFLLTALTVHSIAIYAQYTNPSTLVILAILVLFLAIFYRTKNHQNNLMIYTLGWTLELLTINITTMVSQSLILLAIVNFILGFLLQLIGKWWQKNTGQRQFLSSLHTLPLLYGALGSALRYNSFNSLTGFISFGFAFIIIGFVRQKRSLKPLIYLGIILISLSAYELLSYQISNLSWGDKYLSMAALATTIMYVYRLSSPWLSSYLYLTPRELKIIAHSHWILGSIFLVLSLLYPVESQQLIALGSSAFLTQYAILEGRNFLDKRKGEIWVYLGFIQAFGTTVYGVLTFPYTFLLNVIGSVLSLLGIVIYTLPWERWGWSKRPWNLLAFSLPFMGVISHVDFLTLIVASISYGLLAKLSNKSRLLYLSIVFVNAVAYNISNQFNQLSPLLYSSLFCLSLLFLIMIEPYCQREEGKKTRHFIRLIATATLSSVYIIFYRETAIIPGVIGLILIAVGLGIRTRAFLFIGTITFLATVFDQLVIVSFTYPLLKWMVGLLLGLMFIWIAASFENRRNQISSIMNHWIEEFATWE
ncbi:hypothetical protein [Crocosphaera sp. Alani8]|uniref:hypothetical protein n=1 Tax=Crocosphaera sp. Alani8 TaxID=3038952 RepID=UPI00313C424F